MQMVDDIKPAEVDDNKKKYGNFLAHFEKLLWVDNSEQSSSTAAAGVNPPAFLDLQWNMCLFEKVLPKIQARKENVLERRCLGLHCWAKLEYLYSVFFPQYQSITW